MSEVTVKEKKRERMNFICFTESLNSERVKEGEDQDQEGRMRIDFQLTIIDSSRVLTSKLPRPSRPPFYPSKSGGDRRKNED